MNLKYKELILFMGVFISTLSFAQTSDTENQALCSSFYPIANKTYIISGWVKEDIANVKSYSNNVAISVAFKKLSDDTAITPTVNFRVSGYIIDGWQRVIGSFTAPTEVEDAYLNIDLVNNNSGIDAFFDDIRVFPYNGTLKSFVYDEETQRLMAELDENNYATYYEYDQEGGLVRVKKETEKGVYTIQETRSSTAKSN